MKVDCNLKKLANIFKFFLCILENSLKIDHGLNRRDTAPLIIDDGDGNDNTAKQMA